MLSLYKFFACATILMLCLCLLLKGPGLIVSGWQTTCNILCSFNLVKHLKIICSWVICKCSASYLILCFVSNSFTWQCFFISTDDAIWSARKKKKSTVFDCSKDGCTKTFNSNQALENYLLLGDCFDMSEQSKLKIWMKSKPVILKSNPVATALPSDVIEGQRNLLHEWALKSKERRGTFSDKQTKYRKGNFFVGNRTGSETDPYRAAIEMEKYENWSQFF